MQYNNHESFAVLKNLTAKTQMLEKLLLQSRPLPSLAPPEIVPQQLSLPFPSDMVSTLRSANLPSAIIDDVIEKLHTKVRSLQEFYQTSYELACRNVASISSEDVAPLLQKQKQAYETLYQQSSLPTFRKEVDCFVEKVEQHRKLPGQRKRPFNSNSLPLLEQYFEINAYPTMEDRCVLAEKSQMTTRQIEVWFQNHRNRARKEGKDCRRTRTASAALRHLPDHLLPVLSLPSPPNSAFDSDGLDSDLESDQLSVDQEVDVFQSAAPPHAFPTAYSPSCEYDPFPTEISRSRFPPPDWVRKPASRQHISTSPDIDDLICRFTSQLSFKERRTNKRSRNTRSQQLTTPSCQQPWFSMTTTVPCSAPHPALIRSTTSDTPHVHRTASAAKSLLSQSRLESALSHSPKSINAEDESPPRKSPPRTPFRDSPTHHRVFSTRLLASKSAGGPLHTLRVPSHGRNPFYVDAKWCRGASKHNLPSPYSAIPVL